jgi:hypothetical protein
MIVPSQLALKTTHFECAAASQRWTDFHYREYRHLSAILVSLMLWGFGTFNNVTNANCDGIIIYNNFVL